MSTMITSEARFATMEDMYRFGWLQRDHTWPASVAELESDAYDALLQAGTKLVVPSDPLYAAQRDLFQFLIEAAVEARVRAYCLAVLALTDTEWEHFAQFYSVPRSGGIRVATAFTAYVQLFPTRY